MTQQLMNQMQGQMPGSTTPPTDPMGTLVISVGRPNCGWIRRMLFEQKALGRITFYAESTGWLWRSFSIEGRRSSLDMIWRHLSNVFEADKEKARG